METSKRIPAHIGVIPDGNRRWATENGFEKKDGYEHGINPGFELYELIYDIPRVDLIIRWGGRRRLSGFLPVQSVYADFYIIDDYWPGFNKSHFIDALRWYQNCDVTLGG